MSSTDVEATGPSAAADAPAVGAALTLFPSRNAQAACVAEVQAWSSSPSGLVVTTRVATTPDAASLLHGLRVWASGRTAVEDSLVVFEALARLVAEGRRELELTGVPPLAREHRRAQVRAAVQRPAEVSADDTAPARTTTVDLSREGCRIKLAGNLAQGQSVTVSIDLDDATRVGAVGSVLRVDADRVEAV